jgi:hypothetical protein
MTGGREGWTHGGCISQILKRRIKCSEMPSASDDLYIKLRYYAPVKV